MSETTDIDDAAPSEATAADADAVTAPQKPRGHLVRNIALAVAALVAVFVAVLATRDAAVTRLSDSPLLGRAAPAVGGSLVAIPGADVAGTPARLELADLRGKYVVVNFFATWCVPCQREHPELVRFQNRHAAAGDATVLSVIFDDEPAKVAEFFASKGGDWPVIDDPDGKIALEFGVRGPPESFLVDPEGFVLFKVTGEVDADGLERLLRQAKSGPR